MAKNQDIFFTKDGVVKGVTVVPGVPVAVFTAGADGAKVLMLNCSAVTGGAVSAYEVLINTGGSDELLGRVTSTLAEGADIFDLTIPSLPLDKNGNHYLNLPAAAVLLVDVTGPTSIGVGVYAEDY